MSERLVASLRGVMNRYFKRRWDEPRGDDHDSWGHSTWFFELGSDGQVVRQVEGYDTGPVLRYGPDHAEEEYGGIGPDPLEASENWSGWATSPSEFEAAWTSPEKLPLSGMSGHQRLGGGVGMRVTIVTPRVAWFSFPTAN